MKQTSRSSGDQLLRLSASYGFPNLSACSFSCLACSPSNLALSSASACFRLRYSKSITVSVRLWINALFRSRLKFISSKLMSLSSGDNGILYHCLVTAAYVPQNGCLTPVIQGKRYILLKKESISVASTELSGSGFYRSVKRVLPFQAAEHLLEIRPLAVL